MDARRNPYAPGDGSPPPELAGRNVSEPELAALIMALHRSVQRQLPVTLLGAGLPQLVARTATAKSYARAAVMVAILRSGGRVGCAANSIPCPYSRTCLRCEARDLA